LYGAFELFNPELSRRRLAKLFESLNINGSEMGSLLKNKAAAVAGTYISILISRE
jgi:hypothetical protein